MTKDDDDWERLPGLYRAFDLPLLLEESLVWRLEDAGRTEDGQGLFAVWVRERDDG
ncbi:hypothetical protein [Oceanicola sp. 22II-s10i]|uniref:hypothetical protein n=1 Tax=Oceanicola sp. 22II-s10i TaxID=1317116 RepID=UPI001595D4DC|nr:hypothetical protein [Oceanicola sp. 22II-s10i]